METRGKLVDRTARLRTKHKQLQAARSKPSVSVGAGAGAAAGGDSSAGLGASAGAGTAAGAAGPGAKATPVQNTNAAGDAGAAPPSATQPKDASSPAASPATSPAPSPAASPAPAWRRMMSVSSKDGSIKHAKRAQSLQAQRATAQRSLLSLSESWVQDQRGCRKAMSAMVSFDRVHGSRKALELYKGSSLLLLWLCQSRGHRFQGRRIVVAPAPKPSTILHQNVGVSACSRRGRACLTLTLSVLLLIMSGAALYVRDVFVVGASLPLCLPASAHASNRVRLYTHVALSHSPSLSFFFVSLFFFVKPPHSSHANYKKRRRKLANAMPARRRVGACRRRSCWPMERVHAPWCRRLAWPLSETAAPGCRGGFWRLCLPWRPASWLCSSTCACARAFCGE